MKHTYYYNISSAVYKADVTDHYMTIAKIKYKHSVENKTAEKTVTYVDNDVLSELLRNQSWDEVLSQGDVDKSCNLFVETLQNLKSLSTKQKRISSKLKKIKPWITVDLIKGIRKRDKLSKLVKQQPFNDQLRDSFCRFRNELSKLIKSTKNNYYKKQIMDSNGKPKVFWNIINEYSGVGKSNSSFPLQYFLNGSKTADDAVGEVANSFNSFFSQVGRKLASELPPLVGPPVVDDSAHRGEHVFQLEPVTGDQVRRCVQDMRGGSAPGVDGFSTLTLKNNIYYLLRPLMHIVNLSITSGVFPSSFKLAKVTPIFKTGEKSNVNNYRPISLLSVISKVLEKLVKLQLQNFLESNKILSNCQFGFRENKNPSDALFLANKRIFELLNANKKCLTVFIDLAKAFDSLDRNLLLYKLDCVGVRGVALNWFKSYLSDRKQVVSILNQVSNALDVEYGVVQGSTLGPILFLIYINNLDKLNIAGDLFLFADDTAVIFEGDTWKETYQRASTSLTLIKLWFEQNVLSMNVSKTKFLPIALRTGGEPPEDLRVVLHSCGNTLSTTCNCHSIERVDQYKYLGVIIDSKLRYEQHVISLKNKLRKIIFPFYQLSQILNLNEFKMVYCAFVQSVLNYGIVAYGGTYKTILEPLSVVQKTLIKVGLQKNKRYPTELLFKETSILTLRQLYVKTLLTYTFLHKELVLTPISHSYQTRNAQNIGIQMPRVTKSCNNTNSFFIANFLYRNIPAEIRDAEMSISSFKRLITAWLINLGSDNVEALLSSVYALT